MVITGMAAIRGKRLIQYLSDGAGTISNGHHHRRNCRRLSEYPRSDQLTLSILNPAGSPWQLPGRSGPIRLQNLKTEERASPARTLVALVIAGPDGAGADVYVQGRRGGVRLTNRLMVTLNDPAWVGRPLMMPFVC